MSLITLSDLRNEVHSLSTAMRQLILLIQGIQHSFALQKTRPYVLFHPGYAALVPAPISSSICFPTPSIRLSLISLTLSYGPVSKFTAPHCTSLKPLVHVSALMDLYHSIQSAQPPDRHMSY